MASPHPQGLYDPANERDACGVAFVADLAGRRSHDVVAKGLSALRRLDHRGARGAEPNTGDGAGVMIQVPDAFLRAVVDFPLPPAGQYATGLVFLPTGGAEEARAVTVLEKYALVEGAEVLGWRDVPINPRGIGATALAARPRIRQVFLAAHRLTGGPAGRAAGRPRAGPGRVLRAQADRAGDRGARRDRVLPVAVRADDGLQGHAHARPAAGVLPGPAPTSGSRAPSRWCTRGSPPTRSRRWPLAHPYRFIAHNGEINTIRGNKNWMNAREALLAIAGDRRATSAGSSRSARPARPTRPTSTRCSSCCTWPAAACRTRC